MRTAWWLVLVMVIAAGTSRTTEAPADPVDAGVADPCSVATACAECTPRDGCGWCGETAQCVSVNSSCSGPQHGYCGRGWACTPTQCPGATTCRPCRSDRDCNGASCVARDCDGERACVRPGSGFQCATIEGRVCPAIPMWHPCTNDGQCGPSMVCVDVWPGRTDRRCQRRCYGHQDCPRPPSGATAETAVFCSDRSHSCQISCRSSGSCGGDQPWTCRTSGSDSYAYCL